MLQPSAVSNRICQNCSDGFFKPAIGQNTTCQPVSVCNSTTVEITPPTRTSDRVCGNCPNGTFAEYGRCRNLSTCPTGFQILANATTSSDQTCVACAPGTTDDDANGNTPCVQCIAGEYTNTSSIGPCSNFLCSIGTVDNDSNPSTPCVPCSGVYDFQSSLGMTSCTPVTPCAAGTQQLRVRFS